MNKEEIDIIGHLKGRFLDHAVEKIFMCFDVETIIRCEQVCKLWKEAIADAHVWKKILKNKIETSSTWRRAVKRMKDKIVLSTEDGNAYCKKIVATVQSSFKRIMRNWIMNKCKVIHDSHPSWDPLSASFIIDDDHIIMNWRKELYVTDRMKKGRLLKVITSPSLIRNFHLSNSFVAVVVDEDPLLVKVFSIMTGKELYQLTLQRSDLVAQVRLFGQLLVLVSRQIDRNSKAFPRRRRWHLCIWKITGSTWDLVCEKPFCDSYQLHGNFNYKLFVDENYIVLVPTSLYGETEEADVFVISMESLCHYRTISCGSIYTGAIHYQNGILAYATDFETDDLEKSDVAIRIVDVTTGSILNTLATDDYPDCLRFNSNVLVTTGHDYSNDSEAGSIFTVFDFASAVKNSNKSGDYLFYRFKEPGIVVSTFEIDDWQLVAIRTARVHQENIDAFDSEDENENFLYIRDFFH